MSHPPPPNPPVDLPAVPVQATQSVAPGSPAPTRERAPSHVGFSKLDPRALTLGLIGGAISWLFLAVPITGAVVAIAFFADPSSLGATAILGLAVAVLVTLALLQIALQIPRFRKYRYRADDLGLEIHRGVLWRSRIFIPRSRIQHTDVNQGPIERQLGLAKLIVHTAGTVRASTTVSGLAHATALQIRAALAEDSGGTDGV